MSDKRSALDALSAEEKATVLDELLAARPDLRELTEAYAAQAMTDADRSAVADDVEDSLQGLDIEELNTRAGYRPGRSYVHPAEAADEILDEGPATLPGRPSAPGRPRHAIRSRRTCGGHPARPVQLPPRQLRDAAGVLPGLRGRARVRCGERLREARSRPSPGPSAATVTSTNSKPGGADARQPRDQAPADRVGRTRGAASQARLRSRRVNGPVSCAASHASGSSQSCP